MLLLLSLLSGVMMLARTFSTMSNGNGGEHASLPYFLSENSFPQRTIMFAVNFSQMPFIG